MVHLTQSSVPLLGARLKATFRWQSWFERRETNHRLTQFLENAFYTLPTRVDTQVYALVLEPVHRTAQYMACIGSYVA